MRIAVMGAGGIGGNLGGLLARGGNDVSLIVRGAHLEAIQGTRESGSPERFTPSRRGSGFMTLDVE